MVFYPGPFVFLPTLLSQKNLGLTWDANFTHQNNFPILIFPPSARFDCLQRVYTYIFPRASIIDLSVHLFFYFFGTSYLFRTISVSMMPAPDFPAPMTFATFVISTETRGGWTCPTFAPSTLPMCK